MRSWSNGKTRPMRCIRLCNRRIYRKVIKNFIFKKEQSDLYKQALASYKDQLNSNEKLLKQYEFKLHLLQELQQNPSLFHKLAEQYSNNYQLSLPLSLNIGKDGDKNIIDTEIKEVEKYIAITRDKIRETKNKISLSRPHTQADLSERDEVVRYFSDKIRSFDPQNLACLRFKGVPPQDLPDILSSMKIASSKTRLGHITNAVGDGLIAVSSLKNLDFSIDYFTSISDKSYKDCLPSGTLFVLQPNSAEEADKVKFFQMYEIDFTKEPEKLIAIVSTQENLPVIQKALNEKGLSTELVMTFANFDTYLRKNYEKFKKNINFDVEPEQNVRKDIEAER